MNANAKPVYVCPVARRGDMEVYGPEGDMDAGDRTRSGPSYGVSRGGEPHAFMVLVNRGDVTHVYAWRYATNDTWRHVRTVMTDCINVLDAGRSVLEMVDAVDAVRGPNDELVRVRRRG